MSNTIRLTSPYGRHEEFVAAAAFSPGHLLERDSANKVKKHATEGGYFERLLAVEDALQGKTNDLTTGAYSTGDNASTWNFLPGDTGLGVLKAGENVAIGAQLCSDGAGRLIAIGSVGSGVTVKQVVFADEAKNLSASGAADAHIKIRFA